MAKAELLRTVREDDFIEYFIFPQLNENEEANLSKHLQDVNSLLQMYTKEYIWHKDDFSLAIRKKNCYLFNNDSNNAEVLPGHLHGILHYGDNIEDEWFTTFLLYKISVKFENFIIRVVDNDGEFLLIESANHLPSWAEPEACEKRVYIHKGKIHIIPFTELQNNEVVNVTEALEIIRSKPLLTEATSYIQDAILKRISGYPGKLKECLHHAKVYVPVAIAAILNQKPGLLAHAITAFCNRDPIDLKACRAMKYFPPENRVYTRVTFTKCLYAMLTHSSYSPDARTGWNIPAKNSPQFKSQMLGIKIACGFEILASQARPPQDLESDCAWHQYLEELKKKLYFKDLLEHSQEYNNLLNCAKDYFKNNKDMIHVNPIIGQQIINLNCTLEYNTDDLKKAEQTIPDDDSESWLEIDPENLEHMLVEQYGQKPQLNQSSVAQKLNEFLVSTSDIEGVEFPTTDRTDVLPVRLKTEVKKRKDKIVLTSSPTKVDTTENTKINFDASNFSCAVQNILELIIPEDSWDLESGSEMSEYEDEPDLDLSQADVGKVNNKIQEYMDAMDRELANTSIGQSFEKESEDKFDDIESFKPVDINVTVVKNMLESYQLQMGGPGPATNLLGPMGLHLETASSSNKPDLS